MISSTSSLSMTPSVSCPWAGLPDSKGPIMSGHDANTRANNRVLAGHKAAHLVPTLVVGSTTDLRERDQVSRSTIYRVSLWKTLKVETRVRIPLGLPQTSWIMGAAGDQRDRAEGGNLGAFRRTGSRRRGSVQGRSWVLPRCKDFSRTRRGRSARRDRPPALRFV